MDIKLKYTNFPDFLLSYIRRFFTIIDKDNLDRYDKNMDSLEFLRYMYTYNNANLDGIFGKDNYIFKYFKNSLDIINSTSNSYGIIQLYIKEDVFNKIEKDNYALLDQYDKAIYKFEIVNGKRYYLFDANFYYKEGTNNVKFDVIYLSNSNYRTMGKPYN